MVQAQSQQAPSPTHPQGWEDLSAYRMADAESADLLAQQIECTFIWHSADGHPIGAVVNYVFRKGSFWVTATDHRPRIVAIRADPRVSVVISSRGSAITARRSITCRGSATVHDDPAVKAWMLPELAAAVRPGSPSRAAEFAKLLDSPGRLVIQVTPQKWTGFDGAKMWSAAPAAAPTSDMNARIS
jgi:nitroimidazol reductase NimA-like FMN-containing flavoprotein (pyridoxamine 5'-phosphate oxidase superfamily)